MSELKLGKMPARSDTRALMFANYLPKKAIIPPKATNYWKRKTPVPLRMFGNDKHGDCTRASQANAALRRERIEQRRNIEITDEEVIRVYYEMTKKYYGGGDTGGYEMDALNEWRKQDCTFRDTKGNPYTIDAFTRINHMDINELKISILTSGFHGVKLCLNLPAAWSRETKFWDIPEGKIPIGSYSPGSWGGHSLFAEDYDEQGIILPTWDFKVKLSWNAYAIYCDETYSIIDSINAWKKKGSVLNLDALKSDVNAVSSQKIK